MNTDVQTRAKAVFDGRDDARRVVTEQLLTLPGPELKEEHFTEVLRHRHRERDCQTYAWMIGGIGVFAAIESRWLHLVGSFGLAFLFLVSANIEARRRKKYIAKIKARVGDEQVRYLEWL